MKCESLEYFNICKALQESIMLYFSFLYVLFSLVYSELEAKQKTELQMRNLQLDLRTANNNIKQVNQQQTEHPTAKSTYR